jgi:AraC family transcriptional regulator
VGAGFAKLDSVDGVGIASADVNGFTLAELRFPAGYEQGDLDPETPYLAFVLDGSLEKSFRGRTMRLERGRAVTMPAGARHSARFGPAGARIAIVKLRDASKPSGGCLDRLVELRAPGLAWIAGRLADELRASDTAAPLAAEGFALELLAATSRERGREARARTPAWLREAEELLRERDGECVRLGDLAEAVGVHPASLARAFRERHGISVGDYGRRLRLERAAVEIARTDAPLAAIATEAGFADQSHFTRLFKRHLGTTPARYRLETQARRVPVA